MHIYTDRIQENKSKTPARSSFKKQHNNKFTPQFTDNRPEAIAQRKLQEEIRNNPKEKQLKAIQAMANTVTIQRINGKKEDGKKTRQGAFESAQKQTSPEQSRKENSTGLPDNLKTGIENLSGIAVDDVKVHYNSPKPARLQAYAYAQGTNIHVAPKQEKHLPHEAWHVVQQKQGRVKPTIQLKGKMNINDDAGLEKEADVMGRKALRQDNTQFIIDNSSSIIPKFQKPNSNTIQRIPFNYDEYDYDTDNLNGIREGLNWYYQNWNKNGFDGLLEKVRESNQELASELAEEYDWEDEYEDFAENWEDNYFKSKRGKKKEKSNIKKKTNDSNIPKKVKSKAKSKKRNTERFLKENEPGLHHEEDTRSVKEKKEEVLGLEKVSEKTLESYQKAFGNDLVVAPNDLVLAKGDKSKFYVGFGEGELFWRGDNRLPSQVFKTGFSSSFSRNSKDEINEIIWRSSQDDIVNESAVCVAKDIRGSAFFPFEAEKKKGSLEKFYIYAILLKKAVSTQSAQIISEKVELGKSKKNKKWKNPKRYQWDKNQSKAQSKEGSAVWQFQEYAVHKVSPEQIISAWEVERQIFSEGCGMSGIRFKIKQSDLLDYLVDKKQIPKKIITKMKTLISSYGKYYLSGSNNYLSYKGIIDISKLDSENNEEFPEYIEKSREHFPKVGKNKKKTRKKEKKKFSNRLLY